MTIHQILSHHMTLKACINNILPVSSLFIKQLPDCFYRSVDEKKSTSTTTSTSDKISKKREKNHDDKNGRKDDYDSINDDKLKDKNKPKIRRVSYSDIVSEEIDDPFQNRNVNKR